MNEITEFKIGRTFGYNLSNVMEKSSKENGKMTVEKLSELSGVSKSTIQSYKSGEFKKPTIESAMKIAMALGVTVESLCGLPDDLSNIKAKSDNYNPVKETMLCFVKLIELGILPLPQLSITKKDIANDLNHSSTSRSITYNETIKTDSDGKPVKISDCTFFEAVYKFLEDYLLLTERLKDTDILSDNNILQICLDKHCPSTDDILYLKTK